MVDATNVIFTADIIILLIIIVLTVTYLLPIVLVRRFHTATNILTGNVCLTSVITCLFWAVNNILSVYYPTILIQSTTACYISKYLSVMVNCLVIYALGMVTINRFFTIIYPNKRLFKRRAWPFISSGIQWMIAIMLAIPQLIVSFRTCVYRSQDPFWSSFYSLSIIVILPSIVNAVVNSLMFVKVRSSTRRVHVEATPTAVATNPKQPNARDVHLLKHMLFIFVVFIVGWAPVYILAATNTITNVPLWVSSLLQVLPVISSLINILDLFLYNHELRQYLRERLFNRRN